MNWVLLGAGVLLVAMGISFVGPHRKGVGRDAVLKPLFHVILYSAAGVVFIVWAILGWAFD